MKMSMHVVSWFESSLLSNIADCIIYGWSDKQLNSAFPSVLNDIKIVGGELGKM
jgi:hypothetical protein